jgi:hypothetical protein
MFAQDESASKPSTKLNIDLIDIATIGTLNARFEFPQTEHQSYTLTPVITYCPYRVDPIVSPIRNRLFGVGLFAGWQYYIQSDNPKVQYFLDTELGYQYYLGRYEMNYYTNETRNNLNYKVYTEGNRNIQTNRFSIRVLVGNRVSLGSRIWIRSSYGVAYQYVPRDPETSLYNDRYMYSYRYSGFKFRFRYEIGFNL